MNINLRVTISKAKEMGDTRSEVTAFWIWWQRGGRAAIADLFDEDWLARVDYIATTQRQLLC